MGCGARDHHPALTRASRRIWPTVIQSYLGRTSTPYRQDFTALVGQAGEQVNGIYEADYRDFNRDTYPAVARRSIRTYAELQASC